MQNNFSKIGPVQILAVAFKPDAKFTGKILNEFQKLEKTNILRVLDLLFVRKEKDKSLTALDYQGEELGGVIGALMGFEFKGVKHVKQKSIEGISTGVTLNQIEKLGEELKPGMAAGIVLLEHVWAKSLKNAIRSSGGIPIAEGFVTPEALSKVSSEISELADAMDQMDEEEKHIRMYNF